MALSDLTSSGIGLVQLAQREGIVSPLRQRLRKPPEAALDASTPLIAAGLAGLQATPIFRLLSIYSEAGLRPVWPGVGWQVPPTTKPPGGV